VIAYNWRKQLTDPAALLARYRMKIEPGPVDGWHVVELRETYGRPELRNIVLGTRDPVAFDWLNIGANNLKSEMKTDMLTQEEENTLNLGGSFSSYYRPMQGQDGPNHVKVQGNSDTVRGWGMALDLPDQPPASVDNRYQTVIVVWKHGAGWAPPEPVPPVVPPPPGSPYVGMNEQDVLGLRALAVASRDAADESIRRIDRFLEGVP